LHGRGLLHHFLGCLQQLSGLRRRVDGRCGWGRCRLGGWRLCRGCGLRLSRGLLCSRLGVLGGRFFLGGRLLLRWCVFSGRLLGRSLFGRRVLGWRLLCVLGLGVGGGKRLPMLGRLGDWRGALLLSGMFARLANRCNLLRDDGLLGAELGQLRLLARDLQVVPQSVDLLVEVLLDRTHLLLGLQVDLVALELLGKALFALDLVLELLDLRADLIVLRLDGLALALDGRLGLLGEGQALLEMLGGFHFELGVCLCRRTLGLVRLHLFLDGDVVFQVDGTLRGLVLHDRLLLGFWLGQASKAQQLVV